MKRHQCNFILFTYLTNKFSSNIIHAVTVQYYHEMNQCLFYFLCREVDKSDDELLTNPPQAPIPLPASSDAVCQTASSSATAQPSSGNVDDVDPQTTSNSAPAQPSSGNVADLDPSSSTVQATSTPESGKKHVLLTAQRPSTKPKAKPKYKTYSDRYSNIKNSYSSSVNK